MISLATTCTIATALTLIASPAPAAPGPTLSDIAGCNEEAAERTGASASPHPGRPADPGVGSVPSPGPSTPLPRTGRPAEKTDPSGSIITETPDPLLKGMDAARADDPQYRAAYRACMRDRLGPR